MDQAKRATQTESNEVLYDVADHIAVITLNASERMNTISRPMLNDLTRLLVKANEDRDVRCVILTGNGRAFCAGLDLRKERSGDGLSAASSATSLDLRNTPPTVLQAMDKPTICAVNGGAAGYGMGTALGCDIRINGGIRQVGRGLRQAWRGAGIGWYRVLAAHDRLGQGIRTDFYRAHALSAGSSRLGSCQRHCTGRNADGAGAGGGTGDRGQRAARGPAGEAND